MQISRKYTIIGILIVAIVLAMSVILYISNKPVSFLNTPSATLDPTPGSPFAPPTTPYPSTSPTPIPDTRTWGERFRDKTIPDVPGVEWQTYTNQKYGFKMDYPRGWYIETQTDGEKGFSSLERLFEMQFSPSKDFYLNTFFSLQIRKKSLLQFIREDLSPNRNLYKRFQIYPIIPDAMINGLGIIIDSPDLEPEGMSLWVFFEKNAYTYILNQHEPGFDFVRNGRIAEHMAKTFRFLK